MHARHLLRLLLLALGLFQLNSASGLGQAPSREPQIVLDALGFTTPVHCLALSNDGHWLAAAAEKVVRIWDLQERTLHATLRGYQEPYGYHVGFIDSMVFSPDSRFLLVGVSDNFAAGSTRVYDVSNPGELRQLVQGHLGCTRGVTFSSSGDLLATWGCDGNVIIYDWDTARGVATERFRVFWSPMAANRDGVRAFQFTDNDSYLLFRELGRDSVIDLATRKVFPPSSSAYPVAVKDMFSRLGQVQYPTRSAPLLLKNPCLTISGHQRNDHELWLVNAAQERQLTDNNFWAASWLQSGRLQVVHRHRYQVMATAWNPQANLAASADLLGEIHVWNPLDKHANGAVFRAQNQQIWNVQWHPRGDALRFSTSSLPQGEFDYNNFGGISHAFSLQKMLQTPDSTARQVRPKVVPIHTQSGTLELHRRGDLGKQDLVMRTNRGYDRHVNAFMTSPRDDGPSRRARFTNFSLRLNQDFGRISFFATLDYPDSLATQAVILGSDKGKLVEGYFEWLAGIPEFRITKNYLGHSSQITGVDVSPDRRYLATSSLDGSIRVWKLARPRQLGDVDFSADGTSISYLPTPGEGAKAGLLIGDVVQFVGDTTFYERVRAIQAGRLRAGQDVDVVVTRKDKHGVASRLTHSVRLVETPDVVEPTVSFFLARDGEWICWTQTGHYNASSQGARFVGWHVNAERHEPATFYASDQFQSHLYQPEIVKETFRIGDPFQAVEQLQSQLGDFANDKLSLPIADAEAFAKYLPPRISIITPATNANVNAPTVSIRARVTLSAGVDLRETQLLIDGKPYPGRLSPIAPESPSALNEFWLEESIELPPGRHTLRLIVKTAHDSTESSEVAVIVRDPEGNSTVPEVVARGRLFLLAIGISAYENSALNLGYAATDAAAFAGMWQRRQGDVFTEVVSQVLLDQDASVGKIKERGLDWLLNQALTPDDTVIVFLAGHGLFDRFDEWYFGGHELDLGRLSTTGISDAELSAFFRKLPSNTILFTDSCYSGAFQLPEHIRQKPRTGKNHWRGQGKIAFSSCLPQESSLEATRWQHGAFTKAILDYFEQPDADLNQDGYLSCVEMILYVQGRVRTMTGDQQNPTAEIPSGVSDVVFGLARP